jgi:CPA1 family monovalent cation:H+ antiporter
LFLLTGLEFHAILQTGGAKPSSLFLAGAAVTGAIIVARFAWTWLTELAPRAMATPHRHLAFLAWSGMRGGISLAAAFSVSRSVPSRPSIIFVTCCVIAGTLLLQGVTLPPLIRRLGLHRDAEAEQLEAQREEAQARIKAAEAALERLRDEEGHPADLVRAHYRHTIEHLEAVAQPQPDRAAVRELQRELLLLRDSIEVQRRNLVALHKNHRITEPTLHRIERELDLQQELLEGRLPALE